ncbi:SNF5-domain-containing protein [Rhizopus microsporus ATCC 52813]|uniref:SNF5-domain-containing protein n=1 Tax=Rhizopus microsporus ATCC 52813 TaxID=1340429 RepID=A0A2G4T9N8_RHIZD|nr:SNF5-domain-containing protein [Rhizopus microsporus ATCC 52813]PHZ17426.1 SNF5-domain-containing protein [Rhizopus microsporus ATCC 52813]
MSSSLAPIKQRVKRQSKKGRQSGANRSNQASFSALQQPGPSGAKQKSKKLLATTLTLQPIQDQVNLNQTKLDMYLHKEQQHQNSVDIQQKRTIELIQEKKHELNMSTKMRQLIQKKKSFSLGHDHQEDGKVTNVETSGIILLKSKARSRYQHILQSPFDGYDEADVEEVLIPIRLDIQNDGYRICDTFVWNVNDPSVSPIQFARITCDDLGLPLYFVRLIAASIVDQIEDYYSSIYGADEENVESTSLHHPLAIRNTKLKDGMLDLKTDLFTGKTELRIFIKLDITIGNMELNDRFEWDITCKENSPEAFAKVLVSELGLSGEFKSAIAHSIREQIYTYVKSLHLSQYHDWNKSIMDRGFKKSFLPIVKKAMRNSNKIKRFTPSVAQVLDSELVYMEKETVRESRLKRRNTRRGQRAITLPGLEPLATFRFVYAAKLEEDKYSVKERVNTTENVITLLFPYQFVDDNTESV